MWGTHMGWCHMVHASIYRALIPMQWGMLSAFLRCSWCPYHSKLLCHTTDSADSAAT